MFITTKKLFVILAFLFLTVACNIDNKNDKQPANETTTAKLNAYIEFLNHNNAGLEIIDGYFNSVDNTGMPKNGRTISLITSPFDHYSVKEGLKGLTNVYKSNPKFEGTDEIADSILKFVPKLEQDFKVMVNYVNTEEYKNDKFSKAKEMYAILNKESEHYVALCNQLQESLTGISEKIRSEELAQMKKDGLEIHYARGMFLMSSKKFMEMATAQDINNLQKVNKETANKLFVQVKADWDIYFKKTLDKKEYAKEYGEQANPAPFEHHTQSFITQSGSFIELINSKEKLEHAINNLKYGNNSGTPEKVANSYNDMITESNRIY